MENASESLYHTAIHLTDQTPQTYTQTLGFV